MSDLEDELLALAGGDVSSDEEDARDQSRDASDSPAPAPKRKETPARGDASKTPVKKSKKNADESEEEGEASSAPSSPNSQGSAAMEESDSDSEAHAVPPYRPHGTSGDDDPNKYPVDGLFISNAEKHEIMSMREIEREQKIAERREEVERMRQNRMLRQLVTNQQDRDGAGTKKRKAAAADLEEYEDDDSKRKSGRARTKVGGTKVGETSSGIDTLRRAREERSNRKHQRQLEREDDRRGRKRSPSYDRRSASRDRDGGDSDVEWADKKKKSRTPEPKEALEPDLRDVERLRVGKTRFAEVCFYPGFEEAITGCYVRINIGPDPETRQDNYRIAVIKGFTQGRAYALINSQGKPIVTEGYIKAAHGKATREWPFIACSDRPFQESEWNRYKSVCAGEGVIVPKKAAFVKKIDDINKLVQRSWTELELAEKLERQNTLKIKYSGVERERLERAVARARLEGNEEKAVRLQDELDRLETPRLAFRTTLTPLKKNDGSGEGKMSQQDRLALLNLENRRKNADTVRQAQMRERAKAREIEDKVAKGEEVVEDYSRRVKTNIKFIHEADEYEDIREARRNGTLDQLGTPTARKPNSPPKGGSANGTPKSGAKEAMMPQMVKLQALQRSVNVDKNGIPMIHRPVMDDDIIGALDLDIDIEI